MSSPYLPPELLDHVVDFLHDARDALKSCCLTSKSWIPRTRNHLFAEIKFHTVKDVESWKATFRDPSTSPACYTKSLAMKCPWVTTAADAKEGGWIRTFSRVVHFKVVVFRRIDEDGFVNYLLPFHGFSPTIKSLRLDYISLPLPLVFDFIHSFPLLEDLSATTRAIPSIGIDADFDGQPTTIQPSNTPVFTGTLYLFGVGSFATHLLSVTSSLHFRELDLTWDDKDGVALTTSLVKRCCSTLESLLVDFCLNESFSGKIDLSKATKLKDVEFLCESDVRWVAETLRTTTPDHRDLQEITVDIEWILYTADQSHADPASFRRAIGETIYRGWSELDHVLARLSESRPIRAEIRYGVPPSLDEERARGLMKSLLPEATARGIADVVGLDDLLFS